MTTTNNHSRILDFNEPRGSRIRPLLVHPPHFPFERWFLATHTYIHTHTRVARGGTAREQEEERLRAGAFYRSPARLLGRSSGLSNTNCFGHRLHVYTCRRARGYKGLHLLCARGGKNARVIPNWVCAFYEF